jgi:hypothetical protein
MASDQPLGDGPGVERHLESITTDLHQIRRTQVLFRWVMIVLIALYAGVTLLFIVGAGLFAIFREDTSDPFHYEVRRTDDSSGEASVSYLDPESGERVSQDVVMPWTSESWQIESEVELFLTATDADGEAAIVCAVVTDRGRTDDVVEAEASGRPSTLRVGEDDPFDN